MAPDQVALASADAPDLGFLRPGLSKEPVWTVTRSLKYKTLCFKYVDNRVEICIMLFV